MNDPGAVHAEIAPVRGLRRNLRVVLRTALVLGATALHTALWLCGAALRCGAPAARQRWRRRVMHRWCRCICRILGVHVTARDPLPRGASFVVCNHLGYLDIAVLGSLLPVAFVSRADVAQWPLIGPLARWFDTVFIERQQKRELHAVNRVLTEQLAAGAALVLFAEGTSSSGRDLLPFRSPLLAPAADRAVPVHAASLCYRTAAGEPPAATAVCWWGDMAFLPHARALLSVRRTEALVRFAPQPRIDQDRKRLAAALQQDVAAIFTPSA